VLEFKDPLKGRIKQDYDVATGEENREDEII
jgi:hypothetical protein